MRWMHSVGIVRWCRFGPELKENMSGGVGLVCGMKRGIFSIGIITCGFVSGPDTPDPSPSTGVLILQCLNSRCSTRTAKPERVEGSSA